MVIPQLIYKLKDIDISFHYKDCNKAKVIALTSLLESVEDYSDGTFSLYKEDGININENNIKLVFNKLQQVLISYDKNLKAKYTNWHVYESTVTYPCNEVTIYFKNMELVSYKDDSISYSVIAALVIALLYDSYSVYIELVCSDALLSQCLLYLLYDDKMLCHHPKNTTYTLIPLNTLLKDMKALLSAMNIMNKE